MSLLLTSCDEYDSYEQCVTKQHWLCSSSDCLDRKHRVETKAINQCDARVKTSCTSRKLIAINNSIDRWMQRCAVDDQCADGGIEKLVNRSGAEEAKQFECEIKKWSSCTAYIDRMGDTVKCASKECRIKTAKLCSKYPKKK